MNIKTRMAKYGIEHMIDEIYKDPEKGLRKVIDWAEKYAGDTFQSQISLFRTIIENPENPYHSFFIKVFTDFRIF